MKAFKIHKLFSVMWARQKIIYQFFNVYKEGANPDFNCYRSDGLENDISRTLNRYRSEIIKADNKYYKFKGDII